MSYKGLHRKHSIQHSYRYSYYELSGILKCYHCKEVGRQTGYVHSFKKIMNKEHEYSNYVNRTHLKGCYQRFHTFRSSILENLFKTCFYLVFANIKEIGEFISQKRKSVEDSSMNIEAEISQINHRIQQIKYEYKNLTVAIRKGLKYELAQGDIDNLEEEEKKLNSHKIELEKTQYITEKQFLSLSEEYSEDTLLQFIHADNPASRRKIYQELIESAYVKDGHLEIRFTNSKFFLVKLEKNRGRFVQKNFDIKIYFMGNFQHIVKYNSETDDYYIVHLKPKNKVKTERDKLFAESHNKRKEKELSDLRDRIDYLKSIP